MNKIMRRSKGGKSYFQGRHNWLPYLPPVLAASLIGTYLDLYFVGKGIYAFPNRPLSGIFSINIIFTLFGLPLLSMAFLSISSFLKNREALIFILILSSIMTFGEMAAENFKFFAHHPDWKHIYSFIGYNIFFILLYFSFNKLKRRGI